MIVTKELAKDRRFYLELAKVIKSITGKNTHLVILCMKNFNSVLNVDARKILNPGGNQGSSNGAY